MFGKFGKKEQPKNAWERFKDGWQGFRDDVKGAVMGGAREGAKLGVREAVKVGIRSAVKEGIVIEAQRQALGREDALLSENEPEALPETTAARKQIAAERKRLLVRKREEEPA